MECYSLHALGVVLTVPEVSHWRSPQEQLSLLRRGLAVTLQWLVSLCVRLPVPLGPSVLGVLLGKLTTPLEGIAIESVGSLNDTIDGTLVIT